MAWKKGKFEGVWLFYPAVWRDDRGYFTETFNTSTLPAELQNIVFVQDNEAQSSFGVLRGLHYQVRPNAQAKLVRCVSGKILDVIVDIRPDSETFGQHLAVILDDQEKAQLFVPHGFAHGYVVLSPTAIVAYKCDSHYHKNAEGGLLYNDPTLQIDWILSDQELIVSEKDSMQPLFINHLPFI